MVNGDKTTTAGAIASDLASGSMEKLTFYVDEGFKYRQDKLFVSVAFYHRQSDAGLSNRIVCSHCN